MGRSLKRCGVSLLFVALAWVASALALQTDSANYPDCNPEFVLHLGNGRCSDVFNIAACGYDGGDCCECTCKDTGERARDGAITKDDEFGRVKSPLDSHQSIP